MLSIVILISGRGSNMEAILNATQAQHNPLPVRVAAVISNRPTAKGLETARAHGIATAVVDHKAYPSREAFDAALAAEIDKHAPDVVLLAGFMRVLTESFVNRYARRLINIHPSLLPAFPGLHTHEQALKAGVKVHGATVHFVTAALDHGPIIVQAAVPVLADDTPDTLATRVLEQEHQIYPQALRWLAEGRLVWADGDVVRLTAPRVSSDVLVAPPLENK